MHPSAGLVLEDPGPRVVQTTNLVFVELSLDPVAARAALPEMLEPAEDASGFALFYTADGSADGSAGAGSAFYAGVFLKGRDAPDGSPGIFVAQGYYAHDMVTLEFARSYNARFSAGQAAVDVDGEIIKGHGGPVGGSAVKFAAGLQPDKAPLALGTHQYFGERPGGLTTYSVAFAARLFECKTLSFEIAAAASQPLRRLLKGARVTRSSFAPNAPLYFSAPRPIEAHERVSLPDAAHSAVVDVLGGLGRGAIVVDGEGRVLFSNELGRLALGSLLRSGRIEVTEPAVRATLMQLIRDAANARGGGTDLRMVARTADGRGLIIQGATYSGGWKGQPTALLLVGDPRGHSDATARQGLELLGLTPAEARIAAEIGKGRSARATGQTLGLAESTVRSALKAVYAKLDISNKTELANILSKL